ncbi:hypothetical protein V144x_07010 [Gimesia aquarii]|uniref:Uncharacterized protein n=1 Tax=Gimesia aquarii TaxID=2527964 RepID=A0A517VQM8_9PLAN|nr:hypothetical protein V144x_07010 [Gimesia aquarii]
MNLPEKLNGSDSFGQDNIAELDDSEKCNAGGNFILQLN